LGDKWFFYNAAYFRISDFGKNSRLTTFDGYAQKSLDYRSFLTNESPFWNRTSYFEICKQFRDEFRTQYIMNEKWDFLLGLEVRNGIFQANYLTTTESDNAIFNGKVASLPGGNNLAVFDMSSFSQISYQNPAKKFNFSFGGRWDKNVVSESSTVGFGHQFNPRIAAVYYPGTWVFKLVYSEAIFAFPSFTKFSSSVTREIPTDLFPEEATNYEFSANKTMLGNKLTTDLSLYRSEYSNTLTTRKTAANKDQYTNSMGIGLVYGAQFALKYVLNKKFDFYLNSTFNNSIYNDKTTWNPQKDTSFRAGDIAFLSVNAGTGMYLFKEKMHFQLMVNYTGEKYTGVGTTVANNPTGLIPSFLMINASINFNISKYFNFQIRANNLLDQYYISPGIRTGAGTQSSFVPQPGRNFNGTMNFFF
jgi:outer membrane receptor protein involved in Fe transport